MVKDDLKNLPYAGEQLTFVLLLLLLVVISGWMIFLCFATDLPSGKFYSAATWAGTASGVSVTAALFKTRSQEWMDSVLRDYSDTDIFPSGPPSHVTRRLFAFAGRPILHFLIGLSYSQTASRVLPFWAGITCIISYWAT